MASPHLGSVLVVHGQLQTWTPQNTGLQQGAREAGQGRLEALGGTGPGLTCFLGTVHILLSCLHGQEVEEDPQGAGEAP